MKTTTPAALQSVFDQYPADSVMSQLVVVAPGPEGLHRMIEAALGDPEIASKPSVAAGLWLFVDDLESAHEVCQASGAPTCSMWHAILHRREGDFSNAAYWLHRAGAHPALKSIAGYEPFWFLDEVKARHKVNPSDLVALQRQEWRALFDWSLEH